VYNHAHGTQPVQNSRAKQIRHQICRVASQLDQDALITARQSDTDVGCDIKVDSQHVRKTLYDCFVAACKRLTEALRALAETTQPIDPVLAAQFEKLRFAAYTLEKDVVLAGNAAARFEHVRLYILITATPNHSRQDILKLTRACAKGGADCIQLRGKGLSDRNLFDTASEFVKICKDTGVVSIINDRIDIAAGAAADGIHFGQDDLPVDIARRLQTKPMVTGLSTHSLDQLNASIETKINYVGLGPVFPTNTKPDTQLVGLNYVRDAVARLHSTGIYHVAIGGITLDNLNDVLAAGAKTVAVCSAVSDSSNPRDTCKRLKDTIVSY